MNSLVPKVFGSMVNQARSSCRGRLLDRADAVLPVVAGDEVAARVADDRRPELANELEHVAAEALLGRRRMLRLEEPAIDAPAEVLDEGPEEPGVGVADRLGSVQRSASHDACLSLEWAFRGVR